MATSKTKPTVLITGCSPGGIGSALAMEFYDHGFHVFATARNLAKLEHFEGVEGIEGIRLDVTDEMSILEAVEKVRTVVGVAGLDYLVNNAGCSYNSPIVDSDINKVKKMFDVNVFGIATVTRAFLPLLIQANGTVMNVGSIAAIVGAPLGGFYNATKSAVASLTTAMRIELAPLGVKVVHIWTGAVSTKLEANAGPVEIPDGSFYAAIRQRMQNRPYMIDIKRTSPEAFARDVFADMFGNERRWWPFWNTMPPLSIWRGYMASTAWWLARFLPEGLMDGHLMKMTGLHQVKPPPKQLE